MGKEAAEEAEAAEELEVAEAAEMAGAAEMAEVAEGGWGEEDCGGMARSVLPSRRTQHNMLCVGVGKHSG